MRNWQKLCWCVLKSGNCIVEIRKPQKLCCYVAEIRNVAESYEIHISKIAMSKSFMVKFNALNLITSHGCVVIQALKL